MTVQGLAGSARRAARCLVGLTLAGVLAVTGCQRSGNAGGDPGRPGGTPAPPMAEVLPAPVFPGPEWRTASPEELRLRSAVLAEAERFARRGDGSGMITRRGRAVLRWGDPAETYDLKSTTKSIGVTALGLAMADGKLALGDPAVRHHPSLGTPPEANRDTGWIDEITIFHLATHTAGFGKHGGYVDLLFRPGTRWSYSDSGPNWLAECVTRMYARDVERLLFERVFAPIGIRADQLRWRENNYRDPELDGFPRREFGSGVAASVDAMARIGTLYLHGGKWRDRQILPPEFVERATSTPDAISGLQVLKPDVYPSASDHYGMLWWNNNDGTMAGVPRDTYFSWGLHDSWIVVIPSLDIVAARAGRGIHDGFSADYERVRPFIEPIARAALVSTRATPRGTGQ